MKDYSKIDASKPNLYVFVDEYFHMGTTEDKEEKINPSFVEKIREWSMEHNIIIMSATLEDKDFSVILESLSTMMLIPAGFNNMDTEMNLKNPESGIVSCQAFNLKDEIIEDLPDFKLIIIDIPPKKEESEEVKPTEEEMKPAEEMPVEEMKSEEKLAEAEAKITELSTALEESKTKIIELEKQVEDFKLRA
jgi:hypothetical protein